MQLPSSNERGMTWLTKLVWGHLGCEAHASPRSPSGEQQVLGTSWSFTSVEKAKTLIRNPQDKHTPMISSRGSLGKLPSWLR